MPDRIALAEGRDAFLSMSVTDADGFVGRGDRLTFQQLPAPHRLGVQGIRRVTSISLGDLRQIEWLDDQPRRDP